MLAPAGFQGKDGSLQGRALLAKVQGHVGRAHLSISRLLGAIAGDTAPADRSPIDPSRLAPPLCARPPTPHPPICCHGQRSPQRLLRPCALTDTTIPVPDEAGDLPHQEPRPRASTPSFRSVPVEWVEMSFIGWILMWGVFGWIKIHCIR